MICDVKVERQFVPFKVDKNHVSFEYNRQSNVEFNTTKSVVPFEYSKQNQQFGYRIVCSHGALVGDGSCLIDFVNHQSCE